MTTTAGERRGAGAPGRESGWAASTRESVAHLLDRPLTSYYLLLGSSTLLLTIGLIMVLSASSVYSYKQFDGNSYHVFFRQLTWVTIALPAALLASRLPHRLLRSLSWPGLALSVVLIALTQTGLGMTVNGNRNWLALGPLSMQPSEVAKLAVILWCANLYARKEKLLGDWRHVLVPMLPVTGIVVVLVLLQGDLGTALVMFAIVLGMLWVVGAPGRLFTGALLSVGVLALYLATTSAERLQRLTNFADPFKDYQGAGWQPAHGLFAMSSGGILGKGI
ncbi:MAG: FtsW/RodA/SpoVE family cell cycle protein, partial [Nocardioidaceae bacterium]